MDGVMRTVVMKKTEWKEDLYIAVKFVQYMLSKYYAKLTVTMGALPILPNLFDSFQKLPLFGKWGKRMDNTPVHVTTYTTQYWEACLKYVENEYCAKHTRVLISQPGRVASNNHFPSARATGSGQLSFDS